MEKILESKIDIIANEIENCEQQFDNGESGYFFQRIKSKLYGIKVQKRMKDIFELFQKTPVGYKNRFAFRDNDFQFWKEKVNPDIFINDWKTNDLFQIEDVPGGIEVKQEKDVLILHDADICSDYDLFVIIGYFNFNKTNFNELIILYANLNKINWLRKINFKTRYQDFRDKCHVLKYDSDSVCVDHPDATENKINSALFWIDSAISYLKN